MCKNGVENGLVMFTISTVTDQNIVIEENCTLHSLFTLCISITSLLFEGQYVINIRY